MRCPRPSEIALVDLFGLTASRRRRFVIPCEFTVAALICIGIAILVAVDSGGFEIVVAIIIGGIGVNYLILLGWTLWALRALQPFAPWTTAPDWSTAVRSASKMQVWIVVPFSMILAWRMSPSWLSCSDKAD